MRELTACLVLSLLAAAAPAQPAAAAFDPARCAADVAGFLDDQTVAVLRLDLARLNVEAAFDRIAVLARATGDQDVKDLLDAREMLALFAAWMRKAGARELYAVVSLADVPAEPLLVIVPLRGGADERAIRGLLYSGRADGPTSRPIDPKQKGRPRTQVRRVGKAVIRCEWPVWQRVRQMKPCARPELARAFAAAGEGAFQAILLPTPDNRRVIDEMLPALPAEVGGGPTRPITKGLLWAALAIDGPPKMKARLVIQSPDPAAAAAVGKALARLLGSAAKSLKLNTKLSNVQDLLGPLTPSVQKDRLVVDLTHAKIEKLLTGPVAELLRRPVPPKNPKQPPSK